MQINQDNDNEIPSQALGTCPICKKATVKEYRPFCSKRCADVDLGQWLNGKYYIAGSVDSEEDNYLPQSGNNFEKKAEESE